MSSYETRRGYHGIQQVDVEVRGRNGVIEQMRVGGSVWIVRMVDGVYFLVERTE